MEIPVKADLICADGHGGEVSGALLEESTHKVTHVLVRPTQSGLVRRLLPLDAVTETTPDQVHTRLTIEEVAALTALDDVEILPNIEPIDVGMVGTAMAELPVAVPHNPRGTLMLEPEDDVNASDGRIGRLDAVMIDPASGSVTHIVLRKGHLWTKKEVTVPMAHVVRIVEDGVDLDLTKDQIGQLPSVKV
jgi:sporulation protein YlmC with PRC-barrel domain